MCCWRRKKTLKPYPEPKRPDLSPIGAIVFVIAAIPFAVLRFEIALLAAASLSVLTVFFLYGLLESPPPYIESALITDTFESSGGKTFYKIAVAAGRPCKNYTIDQRYSAFDELREELGMSLDKFPPKSNTSWLRKPSDKEKEARCQGLDDWLTYVVAQTRGTGRKQDLRCLAAFLEVPVDKPRTLLIAFKDILKKYTTPSRNEKKTDSEVVRDLVDAGGGKISIEDLVAQLNWSPARAEKGISHFIETGKCWVDTQDPRVQRWFWFNIPGFSADF